MLKDGAKQMSGLEEAVLKNVSLVPLSLLARDAAQAPAPWRADRGVQGTRSDGPHIHGTKRDEQDGH